MLIVQKTKSLIGEDYTAYLLIIISNLCWAFGMVIGSQNQKINFAHIGVARGLAMTIINYLTCRFYNIRTDFKDKKDMPTLIKRNLAMAFYSLMLTLSMKYVPSPIVYTVANTGPLIVFVMDFLIHGTKVSRTQIYGILIATVGMLVTVNSNIILYWVGVHTHFQSKFHYIETSFLLQIVILVGLLGTVFLWAYAVLVTKQLHASGTMDITLHYGYVILFSNLLLSIQITDPCETNIVENFKIVGTVGVLLALSTSSFIGATKISHKSGNVTMMCFTLVIISYVISLVRYSEIPNGVAMIGSAGIFVGLIAVLAK